MKGGCLHQLSWVFLTAVVGALAAYFIGQMTGFVTVPDVVNKPVFNASGILIGEGFKNIIRDQAPGGTAGMVVGQIPSAGRRVKQDTPVVLQVQTGSPTELPSPDRNREIKRVTLPIGTPITVRLPASINVQHQAPPASYEAELYAALEGANGAIAIRGSRVALDVSSSLDTISTTVRLSVRECRQLDGRPLYLGTNQIEFHSSVTVGQIVAIIIICTLIGAVFSGILTFGLDLGLSGASLGFILGIFISIAVVSAGNKVEIPSETVLKFELRDSVQADIVSYASP